MANDDWSEKGYRADVKSLAKWLAEDAGDEYDWKDESDVYDSLNETVDGNMWIIQTYRTYQVMVYTEHRDAYEDAFGEVPEADTLDAIIAPCAYQAMLADIMDIVDHKYGGISGIWEDHQEED